MTWLVTAMVAQEPGTPAPSHAGLSILSSGQSCLPYRSNGKEPARTEADLFSELHIGSAIPWMLTLGHIGLQSQPYFRKPIKGCCWKQEIMTHPVRVLVQKAAVHIWSTVAQVQPSALTAGSLPNPWLNLWTISKIKQNEEPEAMGLTPGLQEAVQPSWHLSLAVTHWTNSVLDVQHTLTPASFNCLMKWLFES